MNKHLFSRRKMYGLAFVVAVLLFSGCTIGYDENATWTSNVKNAQLESPTEVIVANNNDGTATIKWNVVEGAGGYEVSFYNVDNPEEKVPVGEENEFVDGCSVTRDIGDDTKYLACVRTLGNTQLNNTEAKAAAEKDFTTLIETTGTIPVGTDIAEYFKANPLPDSATELAYDLVAGGTYTMNDVVDFGARAVTFRGDKVNHPKVTFGESARFVTCAGLKIKFIDFDCNAASSGSSSNSFILLSNDASGAGLTASAPGQFVITDPIMIQSCEVRGINRHLIYCNSTSYCVKQFTVNDCILGFNQSNIIIHMNSSNAFIAHLAFQNSTLYSTVASNQRFIHFSSRGPHWFINQLKSDVYGISTMYNGVSYRGGLIIQNCTFYNVANKGDMANWSGMLQNTTFMNISNNIFVDSGNNQVIRRITNNNNNVIKSFSRNSYWYGENYSTDGSIATYESNPIETDPKLTDPGNAVETAKDFTPRGDEQLSAHTGDPRWLP
ncbi:DUF4957 domain-containing protein [Bacteroides thetaiotaomicron]|jgi:hypothetical protein|uniref:DUF4957 domain-containing protein n=1 Tax=Bacteroides thetaiotaomicron TaxID=818 RepID=A0A6I0SB89_BACT4|nr:DUF4957 domain-containing protein [Bacteroides thetaiotaomicron]KAB4463467.1 DUF4957 domain-containing protein [Bacteroides thetaiotaomicron]KAB4472928.1 DUF4957 domain-containing protein [Bacteroides thetaiotaomicron]KAB4473416.1 DUF4957 domain-containing protein [Bacteroides thetaiotaomicron]KAB4485394.1 DUF4957 domain-containing protein [Bacteroides thetaiotaomicron]